MIGVKNNTGERFVGRYNGEDIAFEPDVAVAISPEAAAHIFGFGLEDKQPVLQRLGWMRTRDNLAEALERLGKFQFLAVEQRFAEPPTKIPTDLTKPLADPKLGEDKMALDIPQIIKK